MDNGKDSSPGSPEDSARSKGASAFVPRWRKNTVESQPLETPAVDPSPPVHPNLDQDRHTESQGKKFQPRWRQRAEERTAKEEQHRTEAQSVAPSSPVEKPGFQPRWRRTAATDPASEAPPEAKSPPGKRFQPKWRARAEQAPVVEVPAVEVPAVVEAPPKAGFTPRWKRTLAIPTVEEVAATVVEPEVVEPEVVEPPAVEPSVVAEVVAEVPPALSLPVPLALAAPVPEPEAASEMAEVVPAPDLAVPLALAPAVMEPEMEAEPLGGSAEITEVSFLEGAPLLDDGDLWSEPEPEPEIPPEVEKKRLPRPQAAPLPKVVLDEVATDPSHWPEMEVPAPAPPTGELVYQPPVREEPRVIKRLDEEAMAVLKATATVLLTEPNPPAPPLTPPPPPPPPPAPSSGSLPRPTPLRAPAPPPGSSKLAAAKKKETPKRGFSLRDAAIPVEEVATFTRQFSVMIGAGLAIHQALNFFAESYTGPLGKVVDSVATKISSGFRLSAAMSQSPEVFSEVYIGLIELGESTSHIDEALEKLADLLEKQVRLAKRLQSALVYPAFLVAVSMAAVAVFLLFVLPTMIPLFKGFGMTLPLPTRMLLASRHFVWPGFGLVVLGFVLWWWFKPIWQNARRRKAGWAYKVDRMILKLPVFGKFIGQIATARILFALATMIETGLPILNALRSCESVASNLEYASRLEKAGADLRDGSTVTEALALYEVLPRSCLHLMSAGEESAQMAEMVQYAARFYEEEVEHSIDQFMSLVEPVIMCVMGIVVGFIVLSAMLPTVELINHLGS